VSKIVFSPGVLIAAKLPDADGGCKPRPMETIVGCR